MKKDRQTLDQLARKALENVRRAFPHGELVNLSSPEDLLLPQGAHPIFYGAWDWHSSVENHWLLISLLGADISSAVRGDIEEHFNAVLTPEAVRREAAFFKKLSSFEVPYGAVWYLKLVASLEGADVASCAGWSQTLLPLTEIIEDCLTKWVTRIEQPMRNGLHSQTALGLTLWLESARARGREEEAQLIEEKARGFFAEARNMLAFEPQPHDFLSPSFAEAELMVQVLGPEEFRSWLDSFGLAEATDGWTRLAVPAFEGPEMYRLGCHLIGLCLSRAWALERVATRLPHETRPRLHKLADEHREAVKDAAFDDDFIISHWAPCYAWYDDVVRGEYRAK